MVKTSFGGFPPENGCLLLAPPIVSLLVTMTLLSLRGVFGRLRFP
jgi:hypothetical protein